MTSRIGLNIHAQAIPNRGAFFTYLYALQPKAVIVLDEPGTALDIKDKLPNCEVIFRYNGSGGDDGEKLLKYKPADWLNMMAGKVQGDKRIILSAGNEMPLNKGTVDWSCSLIDEANLHGWRIGALSLAVGNPAGSDPMGAWSVAKPLLERLAIHRQHYLFLHEYFSGVATSGMYGGYPDNAGVEPGKPGGKNLIPPENWPQNIKDVTCYHCGRFKFLLAYCDQEGITYPRIGLTEHGEDTLGDIKAWEDTLAFTSGYQDHKGWRSMDAQWRKWYPQWTAEQAYAAMVTYLDKSVYRGSPVEWQAIFSMFQSSADWGPFNTWGAVQFMDNLATYAKDNPEMTFPLPTDPAWIAEENQSGAAFPVRQTLISNQPVATIREREKFWRYPASEVENLVVVKTIGGQIGYCDRGVLAVVPPTPPPSPEEPPVDWKAGIEAIIASLSKNITELESEVAALRLEQKTIESRLSDKNHSLVRLMDSRTILQLYLEKIAAEKAA